MPKFVATHIANVDLSGARRVFAMEHSHVSALLADSTFVPQRISLLGVFDPLRLGWEIYYQMGQDTVAF